MSIWRIRDEQKPKGLALGTDRPRKPGRVISEP